MDILNFDEFFYEVWENVSFKVVNSDQWGNNQEFIREITFDFYNIYKNTCEIKDGNIYSEMSPTRVARLLTLVFQKINKFYNY